MEDITPLSQGQSKIRLLRCLLTPSPLILNYKYGLLLFLFDTVEFLLILYQRELSYILIPWRQGFLQSLIFLLASEPFPFISHSSSHFVCIYFLWQDSFLSPSIPFLSTASSLSPPFLFLSFPFFFLTLGELCLASSWIPWWLRRPWGMPGLWRRMWMCSDLRLDCWRQAEGSVST